MITLYLILKLQTMVKLSQEGQSVVTFLYYKIRGQKQGIYFINQVILILICTPLYSSNQPIRWKTGKSEFWRKTENWHLEFLICLFLHRVLNAKTKKIGEKLRSRWTFWPGRKMGWNGCRPWKWVKFKKKNFSSSWLLCRKLIAYIRNFDRPTTQ